MQEGFEYVDRFWISPDNKFAYTGSGTGLTIFDYNATTGAMVVKDVHYMEMYGFGEDSSIGNFVFSNDGRFVYASVVGSPYVSIFTRDVATGLLTYSSNISLTTKIYAGPDMTISPDDKFLYVQKDAYTEIYKRNTSDGSLTQTAHVYTGGGGIYISNNGDYVYQLGRYMRVYLRNQSTGDLTVVQEQPITPNLQPTGGLAVTPDEKYLFTGADPAGIFRFERNPVNGFLTYLGKMTYPTPENKYNPLGPLGIRTLKMNPTGTRLYACAAGNGDVTSYAVGTDGSLTLLDRKDYKEGPYGLYLSNDGKFIYEFGSNEGELKGKYFTETNNKLDSVGAFWYTQSLDRGLTDISSLVMSSDGQLIYVSGGTSLWGNDSKFLTAFRSGLSNGGVMEEINRVTFESFGGTNIIGIKEMRVTQDKKFLIAAATTNAAVAGGIVLVFAIDASGAIKYQSQIPSVKSLRHLLSSSDGKFLYVTDENNSLRTYSCSSAGDLTLINTLTASSLTKLPYWLPYDMIPSPDGRYVYVVSERDGNNNLITFQRDNTTGLLQFQESTSLQTYGFGDYLDIFLSDQSKMLYLANARYGDGNLQSYTWDPATGKIGDMICRVKTAEDFGAGYITPSGAYLILNSAHTSAFYELMTNGSIAYVGTQQKVGGSHWSEGSVSEGEAFLLPANSNLVYAGRQQQGVWVYSYEDKFPPAPPQKVTAQGGDRRVTVSWEPIAAPGAVYHIYRLTTAPWTPNRATEIAQTAASTFVDTGVPPYTTAYYWVTATAEGSTSTFSLPANATPSDLPPGVPKNAALQAGDKFLKISWSANTEDDLKNYTVYRALVNSSSSSSVLATTTSTTYTDASVDYDKVYYYWVVANDTRSLTSAMSLVVSGKAIDGPPTVPSGVNLKTADKYISLTWNANVESDLAGYRVYRNTSPDWNTATLYSSPTVNQLRDDQVDYGSVYYFWLQAVDKAGHQSAVSQVYSGSPVNSPPGAPKGLRLSAADKYITLTWQANSESDISSYEIFKSTTALFSDPILYQTVKTTTVEDQQVEYQQTYYYEIRAVDIQGNKSQFSAIVSGMPVNDPPAKPTGVLVSTSGKSSTIQWQANQEVDIKGYAVYRSKTSDSLSVVLLGVTPGRTFTDVDGLKGEGFYWVKAYDNYDLYSPFSDVVSVIITATEAANAVRFPVYPNPVSDFLKLEWDGAVTASYIFYDANARPVKQGKIEPGELIDVRDLAAGSYECVIVVNKKSMAISIIKQ
ncbi:beta-propeller fold lactonase family protein [Chryseolinea serpens]|nr:beta-propeller fold lactonase family protein [Chryseolinea serpens]